MTLTKREKSYQRDRRNAPTVSSTMGGVNNAAHALK